MLVVGRALQRGLRRDVTHDVEHAGRDGIDENRIDFFERGNERTQLVNELIGGLQDRTVCNGARNPDDVGGDADDFAGRLIPTTSVAQYGATLAKWMGLSHAQLVSAFPDLAQFTDSDLGGLANEGSR